jgi:UDP-N-acetylglucosamine 2-epimerase (non-hydrolysing)
LHRPANVDDLEWLAGMLRTLVDIGQNMTVLFPVHPRTRQKLSEAKLDRLNGDRLRLMEPLPYLDFLALQTKAKIVITDSGGIQEETTFLGVPCLTVRENTERPVTISAGTNRLVGRNPDRIREGVADVLAGKTRKGDAPELWDGHAAERIAAILTQ